MPTGTSLSRNTSQALARAIAPYVAHRPAPSRPRRPTPVPARVGQWKNALLDLSLRNKLINYTDRAGYRIEVPGPALGRFEDEINATATHHLARVRRGQERRRCARHPVWA